MKTKKSKSTVSPRHRKDARKGNDVSPATFIPTGIDIVALTSRWDYGADSSRVGLLLKMKEEIESEKAEFLVLVGGLVSKRACNNSAHRIQEDQKKVQKQLKLKLDSLIEELNDIDDEEKDDIKKKKMEIANIKQQLRNAKPQTLGQILDGMVEGLAQQIHTDLPPLFCPDGSRMKIYIVTSQAFDGDIGRKVVRRLLEIRKGENDIRYESSRYPENTTFKIPIKKSGRTFAVVVPTKALWRSKYYSTNPDRLVEDDTKRTTKGLCDVYAVGCGASSLNRGRGEMPFQRITVPALHKLEDSVTLENMVGIQIVRFTPDKENCPVKTTSFKDFLRDETKFIVVPKGLTKIQKAIIEEIKKHESTIGMMEHNLEISRDELDKAIPGILNLNPMIIEYDEESQKYFLSQDWLKKKVEYTWPKEAVIKEVVAGFACLHTGSNNTAYHFFVNVLPGLLFDHEVTTFIGVGDLIQGLKHELDLQGEIIPGMANYTIQEKTVGVLVTTVMLKVLKLRLDKMFAGLTADVISKYTPAQVELLIRNSLVDFPFYLGNHDCWPLSAGYKPLDTMESTIRETLSVGISGILKKFNLPHIPLENIISDKIVRKKNKTYHKLPSGILVGGKHYYAGRTATSSTWCQRALGQFKSQICWVANFHVEEVVQEWSDTQGLRIAMQVPTLMSTSAFEENKGKTTDFGFGLMKVWSIGGRIISAETNFLGVNPETTFDNNRIVRAFLREFGIDLWVDLERAIK